MLAAINDKYWANSIENLETTVRELVNVRIPNSHVQITVKFSTHKKNIFSMQLKAQIMLSLCLF